MNNLISIMPGQPEWKKLVDRFLVFNLFIVIFGSLLFIVSIFAKSNGFDLLYKIFERLWFPLFIPAFSLFFTAVLAQASWNWVRSKTEDLK